MSQYSVTLYLRFMHTNTTAKESAMSTTTHTLTNTDGRAEAFASAVNALTGGAGHRVHMNGREVLPSTLLDRAACAYGTGSVSVRVRARKGTGFAQLWVKTGQTAEFTVTPR